MSATVSYFISNSSRAYRSEIALFKHERETADDCWVVQAAAGATILYEIIGPGDRIAVTTNLAEAWQSFHDQGSEAINGIPVAA
jgi:hypothetical protein